MHGCLLCYIFALLQALCALQLIIKTISYIYFTFNEASGK